MTAAGRLRAWVWAARRVLRPSRPRSYWQVWLSAASLPLAALIVGGGLKLIFRTWPQFDLPSGIGASCYFALRGCRQSLALRRQRLGLRQPQPVTATRNGRIC